MSLNFSTLIATSEPSWRQQTNTNIFFHWRVVEYGFGGDKCDKCVQIPNKQRGKTNMTRYDDNKSSNKPNERENGKAYSSLGCIRVAPCQWIIANKEPLPSK